jgi:hypothetical protein
MNLCKIVKIMDLEIKFNELQFLFPQILQKDLNERLIKSLFNIYISLKVLLQS